MPNSHLIRLSAVMISSTIPSAKYSCSGSRLILAKGNTAIDGLSGWEEPAPTGVVDETTVAAASRGFDQGHQHIERPAAERYRPSAGKQLAAMREDAEVAELNARRCVGLANHECEYKPYSHRITNFHMRGPARAPFRSRGRHNSTELRIPIQ